MIPHNATCTIAEPDLKAGEMAARSEVSTMRAQLQETARPELVSMVNVLFSRLANPARLTFNAPRIYVSAGPVNSQQVSIMIQIAVDLT